MNLYTQHFRGRVLTIVSDCSYSGSWVTEAIEFMDEQGVGPCGHMAKKKGILVKVFASCLANEIPAELAFSTYCPQNGSTGDMCWIIDYCDEQIQDDQHPSGIDFTEIQCENKIDQPCTMAPGSTWQKWSIAKSIQLFRSETRGRPTWYYVRVKDFEAAESGVVDLSELGEIVASGWGEDPPEDVVEKIARQYFVDYSFDF